MSISYLRECTLVNVAKRKCVSCTLKNGWISLDYNMLYTVSRLVLTEPGHLLTDINDYKKLFDIGRHQHMNDIIATYSQTFRIFLKTVHCPVFFNIAAVNR